MQPFSVFLFNSFSYEYEQQRLFYALQFQNIVSKIQKALESTI